MSERSFWRNFILNIDANKHTNFAQYPDGMEYLSGYLEARGGPYPVSLFVGLQAFLIEYLSRRITTKDVQQAEAFMGHGLGVRFNRDGWQGIVNEHDGYLPIEIEAVPEGTVLPIGNVLLQVVNTDPKYAWLTTYIETALLRAVWYPTTVGTLSWLLKQALREAFERTSDHCELLRLYLEDFGFRGVSSFESAALGGMAHLVNFDQTNTIAGAIAATQYYNAAMPNAASWLQEHSVTTAWGREHESDSFRKILAYTGDNSAGLLADTYNHENAVSNIIGKELHDEIVTFPGLVTVRCDSGDVITVPADTVERLMENFGYDINSKGFRVLPPNLRVVQGDGLVLDTHTALYAELERRGLAADNVICGMGGGLLQQVNRDTMRFGFKANAVCIQGSWRDVSKSPTGDTVKKSKPGRLALEYRDGQYRTVPRDSIPPEQNLLQPVFRDGKVLRLQHFQEVIERSERPTPRHYYMGT
ncbi:nicotinate phosphoribosyltransferase [Mycobacterium saskatchewanense]|uniref:Nicotinamide phosphoribosyltransferase n=2 Tax=Mycobacterium saskatchewanense TaxID=220927 RepID=A0AAJ3NM44_9MYCO|nr:nicotinate phosphoribosyltransferase [Mycobacterium saskatchewanense]BBX61708.1 nicotinate phosphoribosyltransferase [Mycobacterium saskatchewanense]